MPGRPLLGGVRSSRNRDGGVLMTLGGCHTWGGPSMYANVLEYHGWDSKRGDPFLEASTSECMQSATTLHSASSQPAQGGARPSCFRSRKRSGLQHDQVLYLMPVVPEMRCEDGPGWA